MKNSSTVFVVAAIFAAGSGCHREPSARSAAADLQKAFAVETPAPAGPALTAPQGDVAKQAVNQAVIAIQTNGYAEAFYALRAVQTSPTITVDQYSALQTTRDAVEREVASKAATGDPAALAALAAIKKSGH